MRDKHPWSFLDPRWWADSVHQSCWSGTWCLPLSEGHHTGSECFDLGSVANFYDRSLSVIKTGALTTEQAATLLFRAKALKKWKVATNAESSERRKKAILGFLTRNEEARYAGTIPWPYCTFMKEILANWLPEPERLGWRWTGKFGPGAVAEKLSHPQRFAQLSDWCEFGGPHWPDVPPGLQDCQHNAARLRAVPKDFQKDRLITIEPSYSSFAQAYVREAIQCAVHSGPLRGTCMDLYGTDGQEMQRRLALKASRTGRLATLDLSDASDRITWEQVQQVFPPWVLSLLDVSRSPWVIVDEKINDAIPRYANYPLWIYAGMGNGTTFTIETLFFAAFVKAYARAHGLNGFVSVFGDDIICATETASALMKESFTFFIINHQKSFLGSDALRESCGIFAYKGEDITAPKIDGYPPSWEGCLGLADLHARLKALPWRYAQRLSYIIARCCGFHNWPYRIDGYPSIDDERVERSVAPQTRWNSEYQRVEALTPMRQARMRKYSTDWMSARRANTPEPQVWYTAVLCGMLGRSDYAIKNRRSRRRFSVAVPLPGQFTWKMMWSPVRKD